MPEIAEMVPARSNGLHPGGHPTYRTAENARALCDAVADGALLKEAAAIIGIATASIRDWVRDNPEFATMFARAREDWADSRAEADARLAADEPRMTGKDGEERVDSGWVQHVNTRLNYDRWLMGRRNPKVYGDTAASTTVNVGVVPQIVLNMPVELLQARPLQAEVKRIGGGE